jgi:Na+-transporting methylmalonyl-CoA/oxaloacetate decarboxylase gamma subunit
LIYQARKKNYQNNLGRINSTPTINNTKKVLSLNYGFSFFAFNYILTTNKKEERTNMFEGINGAIQLAAIDMILVFAVLAGLALVMVFLKNIVGIKEAKKISKETKVNKYYQSKRKRRS